MMNRLEAAARQALGALISAQADEHREGPFEYRATVITALREALAEQQEYWEEQPDGSRIPVDPSEMQPAPAQQQAAEPNAVLVEGFGRVAMRKLNDLIAKGYAINGVAITTPTPDGKTEHGQVTTHGKVLWWHQQPAQQAAEPATEADMAVYKAIADNYHASLPQAAEQGHFVVVARRTTPSGRHSHTIESDRPLPIGAVLHTHPAAQQAAEPVADIADLINNLEQLAHRKGELWERCQGKLWTQAESDEFTALRDTLIPRARQELAKRVTAPAQQAAEPVTLDAYDTGLLNDFGGGNVDWWWDYIRAELSRAHDYYRSQIDGITAHPAPTQQPLTQPAGYKLVPVERSYDMRVQAVLHFNTAKKNGADLDDCMDAAWRATLEAAHGTTGSKT